MRRLDRSLHKDVEDDGMKRKLLSLLVAGACAFGASAQAQISDGVIKIGVMSDMSSLYADIGGPGSVVAARMAVEDFGAAKKGMKVEVVSADHQNKPDVGSSVARQWYDTDKVDVIVDVPTSSVALAINQLTREKGKAFLLAQHDPLDLRHLDAGQRHRQRDRQDRW
jgi:branched-chain amino acid transport system substrate-binding protein